MHKKLPVQMQKESILFKLNNVNLNEMKKLETIAHDKKNQSLSQEDLT
jgi:hypothetical protein